MMQVLSNMSLYLLCEMKTCGLHQEPIQKPVPGHAQLIYKKLSELTWTLRWKTE